MTIMISISDDLHNELANRKMFDSETYEEVIWDLVEDAKELNLQTKKDIVKARAEIKAGKFHTFEQVKSQIT